MATCQERSGFLFSHACRENASETCARCSKVICEAHAHPEAGALICSTCAKGDARREQRSNHRRSGGKYRHHDYYHDSPYLYGGGYYGYGHYGYGYWGSSHMHRDDFTEADAQSLGGDASEGFEDDIGGS